MASIAPDASHGTTLGTTANLETLLSGDCTGRLADIAEAFKIHVESKRPFPQHLLTRLVGALVLGCDSDNRNATLRCIENMRAQSELFIEGNPTCALQCDHYRCVANGLEKLADILLRHKPEDNQTSSPAMAANRQDLLVQYSFDRDCRPTPDIFEGTREELSRIIGALNLDRPRALSTLLDLMPELTYLTGGVHATPEGTGIETKGSISERMLGRKHIEFDRTAVGIMVLNWLIEGNYDKFVECQPEAVRLKRASFDELRQYTMTVLSSDDDAKAMLACIVLSNTGKIASGAWDAMLTFMGINDLTKVREVINDLKAKWKIEHIDHDKALHQALSEHPEISPSFMRLGPKFQKTILEGLSAEFNIGQFIQGECPVASLSKVGTISHDALHFYLLHALCDVAGAAGHVNEKGSVVMTESTYQNFKLAIAALDKFGSGASAKEVYESYIGARAAMYGLDINDPEEYAITRIACMLRLENKDRAGDLKSVCDTLPEATRAILSQELGRSGIDDGIAILPYYSPALLANLQTALKGKPEGFENAAAIGMTTLARLFQEGRTEIRKRSGNGVFTLFVSAVAAAAKDPEALGKNAFELKTIGQDAEVVLKPFPVISVPEKRYRLEELPQLRGVNSFTIVAIGGGSDCVQAAQLGRLLEESGRKCQGILSVGSRLVKNAVPIGDGVIPVSTQSVGEGTSGRFLEPLAARLYRTLIVQDAKEMPQLIERLSTALKALGPVDGALLVDTGGDALYGAEVADSPKTTPDQDGRVLRAFAQIPVHSIFFDIACGVDAPDNSSEVLKKGNFTFAELDRRQTESVLTRYKLLELDGSSSTYFGKTPYAWQKALQVHLGLQVLPIPLSAVLNPKNPWNPYVYIQSSMAGIWCSELSEHLKVCGL